MRRWMLIIGVTIAAASIAAALFQRYAIAIPGLITDWRSPIGENRPIDWEQGPAAPRAPSAQRPPNIVLILADDMGFNDISFHTGSAAGSAGGSASGSAGGSAGRGAGGGTVRTPSIDSIAAEGVHFANGYAAHGTCAPSRAALMSGRYGTRFGFEFTPTPDGMAPIVARLYAADERMIHPVHRPAIDDGQDPLTFLEKGMPGSEITLAELLQAQGYHTIHIGKWHLGHENGSAPIDQGFDESLNMASGLFLPADHPDVVNARQEFDPIDRFLWANLRHAVNWNEGPRFRPDGYLTDYFTDAAVDAIAANRNRPFFLYLAHWAPHTPLQALRADYEALAHIDDHTERVYAAMLRALDRGVGRVLDALAEHGLEDDTLVIFTSDNGGAGYIGLDDINRPYRGWKITHFEGGTHVPYFKTTQDPPSPDDEIVWWPN